MNIEEHTLEPAFDFTACESSVLLNQGQTEVRINGNSYTGEGEVRLDLLPRANIHLYGKFQGVPASDAFPLLMTKQKTISSFLINGRQVEGSSLHIGGDATGQEMAIKWSPKSEPINGVGDESTQMTRVVFHLFNFTDLRGTRRSIEQGETTGYAIEHVDLTCDEWKVELKSLLATSNNIKALKKEGG